MSKRRRLHFETFDDAWNDMCQVRQREYVAIGNWTLGRIIQHLTDTITFSIDGFPPHVVSGLTPVPPRMADLILRKGLRAGVQLPDRFEAILPDQDTDVDLAMTNLRAAMDRMATERMESPSPLLGPMNHERWLQGHCRHAELHMSFIV